MGAGNGVPRLPGSSSVLKRRGRGHKQIKIALGVTKAEAEIAEINKDAMSAKKSRAPEPMLAKAKAILSRLSLATVFEPVIDEVLITCNRRNGSRPSENRPYGLTGRITYA